MAVYLKTEMGADHQGPSGRYDAWKDEAIVYAFILDALGMAAGALTDLAGPLVAHQASVASVAS